MRNLGIALHEAWARRLKKPISNLDKITRITNEFFVNAAIQEARKRRAEGQAQGHLKAYERGWCNEEEFLMRDLAKKNAWDLEKLDKLVALENPDEGLAARVDEGEAVTYTASFEVKPAGFVPDPAQTEEAVVEVLGMNWGMVVCAFIGHSRIVDQWFGYQSCRRCKTRIGDRLAGVGLRYCAIDEHFACLCDICKDHLSKLTWRDRLFTPRFSAKEIKDAKKRLI